MKQILKKAHVYFYIAVSVLWFILLWPFLYFFSRKPSRYGTLNRFRFLLGMTSSSCAGFFYRYKYEKEIDWTRTYIVCPNHTSNLDITVVALMMGCNYAFMGKEELLGNPVTRLFFKTIDIPVKRDSKISSFRAFKRAEDYVREGISVIIFPEGQISEQYPPALQPFKNGPFRLAIEQGVPIIPVTISDAWKNLWDDGLKYGSSPGITDILRARTY